jgi:hypothetical protein
MKKLLQFSMFLFLGFSTISNAQNRSFGGILTTIPVGLPPGNTEAFRFRPGLITQLDLGTAFDFTTSSQWSSLGRLTTANQTLYGLRVQRAGKGLVFGYSGPPQSGTTPTAGDYPFIQWIGNSAAGIGAGDLRFETAPDPSNTVSNLVFTLRADGTALLGNSSSLLVGINPKLEINASDKQALYARTLNSSTTGSFFNDGGFCELKPGTLNLVCRSLALEARATGSGFNYGFDTSVNGGTFNVGGRFSAASPQLATATNSYGIITEVSSGNNAVGSINTGILASATGANALAANFMGTVVYGTLQQGSDRSLKTNIKKEERVLEVLGKINPVTYNFIPQKENTHLNLTQKLQHGFIAQELEEVMPELVQDIVYPIFNDKNEQISTRTLKTVNYVGLISVLTASIKELSEEIKALKAEKQSTQKTFVVSETDTRQLTNNEITSLKEKAFFMAQNKPNPFSGSTEIAYSLPASEKNASILILNLNGQTIKEYTLNANEGSITINAGILQKGIYLYSLISNGQEITTKKMVVK